MYHLNTKFATYISVLKDLGQLSDVLDVGLCPLESLFIVAVPGSGSAVGTELALTIGYLMSVSMVEQVKGALQTIAFK